MTNMHGPRLYTWTRRLLCRVCAGCPPGQQHSKRALLHMAPENTEFARQERDADNTDADSARAVAKMRIEGGDSARVDRSLLRNAMAARAEFARKHGAAFPNEYPNIGYEPHDWPPFVNGEASDIAYISLPPAVSSSELHATLLARACVGQARKAAAVKGRTYFGHTIAAPVLYDDHVDVLMMDSGDTIAVLRIPLDAGRIAREPQARALTRVDAVQALDTMRKC